MYLETESDPRSLGPQTATLSPLISTKVETTFQRKRTRLALVGRASRLTLLKEEYIKKLFDYIFIFSFFLTTNASCEGCEN